MGITSSKETVLAQYGTALIVLAKAHYEPGEQIMGQIVLQLDKALPAGSSSTRANGLEIQLSVLDCESVEVYESANAQAEPAVVKHQLYTGKVYAPASLPKGRHYVPFALSSGIQSACDYRFSQSLPENKKIKISRHTVVTACVKPPTAEIEQILSLCVPKIVPAALLEPEHLNEELVTQFPDGSWSRVQVTFPCKKMQVAQAYTIQFSVQNQNSSYRVRAVALHLHQNVVHHQATNGKGHTQIFGGLMRNVNVRSGHEQTFSENLAIPPDVLPSYTGISVSVRYHLLLRVQYKKSLFMCCRSEFEEKREIGVRIMPQMVNLAGLYIQKQLSE